jgi:hypothetical protein
MQGMAVFDPKYPGERYLQLLLIAPTLALTGWWGWTYTGPFMWLAQLQISLFGKYNPLLTWMMLVLVFILPELVVIRLWCKYRGASQAEIAEAFTTGSYPTESRVRARTFSFSFNFAMAGLALAMFGLIQQCRLPRLNHQCRISVNQLANGRVPDSDWITIEASAAVDKSLWAEKYFKEYFIPLVPHDFAEGNPVYAYLYVVGLQFNPSRLADSTEFHGVIETDGLPGAIRYEFEQAGYGPASSYFVISYEQKPEDVRKFSYRLLSIGAINMIAGTVLFLIRRTKGSSQI